MFATTITRLMFGVVSVCVAVGSQSALAQAPANPNPATVPVNTVYPGFQYVFVQVGTSVLCDTPMTISNVTPQPPAPGMTLSSTGFLSGTPTSAGTFTYHFTARNFTNCLPNDFVATLTVTPVAAPVPPAQQVSSPQAVIAVTTPSIQVNNIRQRLDQLRFSSSNAVTEALRVSVDGQTLPSLNALTLAPASKDGKNQSGGGASADKPDPFERWGFFINGDIDIGKQSTVGTQTGFKLTSKGITLGTDYRFEGNHVLGAGLGLLKADANLYDSQGDQDAKGYSVSIYGSFVPIANAYIDGIVNIGHNSYDSSRTQSIGGLATSSTDGNQLALALNVGYAFNDGALTATPYGRVEYIDAKVDGFTEHGSDGIATQSISKQRVKATTLSLGGQVSYAISATWGVLMPYARVEFQHVAHSSAQNVYQTIGNANPQLVPVLGNDKNFGNFAVGASAIFPNGLSCFFNYEQLFSKEHFRDQKYTLGLRIGF